MPAQIVRGSAYHVIECADLTGGNRGISVWRKSNSDMQSLLNKIIGPGRKIGDQQRDNDLLVFEGELRDGIGDA